MDLCGLNRIDAGRFYDQMLGDAIDDVNRFKGRPFLRRMGGAIMQPRRRRGDPLGFGREM